ncbi:MAG: guanylate kinase [Selenomonadaceae bacterium]|nr:guanylate kinase [Selenomonadaceae bacterium]
MANKLFVFIGPYAAGKNTIVSQLRSMGIHFVPIYTTKIYNRKEHKENTYNTVSREDFVKEKGFMVKVSYKGNYYGVKKDDITEATANHPVSVLILDYNGVKQLTKFIKKNVETIYIMTDYVVLVDRMLRLGLRNDEIKYHLEYAETNKEFDNWKNTTHVVKNTGRLNVAIEQVLAIMGLMTLPPQETFDELVGINRAEGF